MTITDEPDGSTRLGFDEIDEIASRIADPVLQSSAGLTLPGGQRALGRCLRRMSAGTALCSPSTRVTSC